MTQFAFGSGTLIGKRTDITDTPPCLLGTLQDVSIDFDRKIETLLGQYNIAVAAGGGEFKITGKAKFARLQATQINNLFLGQTLTANSMLEMTTGEGDTVASAAVTVANSSTFVEDFGVFYASSGVQLTPVAASPTQGQYIAPSGSPASTLSTRPTTARACSSITATRSPPATRSAWPTSSPARCRCSKSR